MEASDLLPFKKTLICLENLFFSEKEVKIALSFCHAVLVGSTYHHSKPIFYLFLSSASYLLDFVMSDIDVAE